MRAIIDAGGSSSGVAAIAWPESVPAVPAGAAVPAVPQQRRARSEEAVGSRRRERYPLRTAMKAR